MLEPRRRPMRRPSFGWSESLQVLLSSDAPSGAANVVIEIWPVDAALCHYHLEFHSDVRYCADLLAVLNCPEWPAASLLLTRGLRILNGNGGLGSSNQVPARACIPRLTVCLAITVEILAMSSPTLLRCTQEHALNAITGCAPDGG